jgi:hypothetical protein
MWNGSIQESSQSFTPAATGKLWTAIFYCNRVGNTTGYAYAKIYSVSGALGSEVPNVLLATSDPLDTSIRANGALTDYDYYHSWETYSDWKYFQFSGANAITLNLGTRYCVTIEYVNGDFSNYVRVGYDGTGVHGGNRGSYNGFSWTSYLASDLIFYVITGAGIEFIANEPVTFSNGATGTFMGYTHPYVTGNIGPYEVSQVPNSFDFDFLYLTGTLPTSGMVATGVTSGATATLTTNSSWEHQYVFQNYQVPWQQDWGSVTDSTPKIQPVIADPLNSYMEFDEDPASGLPDYVAGASIYDNDGIIWTVVLPWDLATRALWVYANPLPVTTKVYYGNEDDAPFFQWYPEVGGSGAVPFTVDAVNPDRMYHSWYSDGAESVVTECGTDAGGNWIKLRPYTEGGYVQLQISAGIWMNMGRVGMGTDNRYVEIWPHPAASLKNTFGNIVW